VEGKHIGGVCLNVGCIPSKALIHAGHIYQDSLHATYLGIKNSQTELDFATTQKWKDEKVVRVLTSGIRMLLQKNNVKIVEGMAKFISSKQVSVSTNEQEEIIDFQQAIIATGSQPIEIPGFSFGGRIIDSTGGLSLKEVPKKLVIIGGGVIGSELGGAYANLGADVTILEGSSQLLPTYEKDLIQVVETSFKKKGIKVVTNAIAQSAVDDGSQVNVHYTVNNQKNHVSADYVMVTVGRRANTANLGLDKAGLAVNDIGLIPVNNQYQTKQSHIYAIGDVIEGPALAHKASYEAKVAAEVICGKNVAKDYRVIPAICFTDPEVASVGWTLAEAKAAGKQVSRAVFPMKANGRALSLNATEGFVRLIFEKETELVMGGQIVGVGASDLIAELTLAIESCLTLEDIALTIHGHPTLSEIIMDVSEIGLGLPIHM
jgi:dihydrolipoamide dehydrogenase